jgi:PTH2 family peptidyl-tRNA hydrolase
MAMDYKQIILIRSDLDMRCGKKCVQVAHASIMGVDAGPKEIAGEWKKEGMRKIVLKVKDLDQLLGIWNSTVSCGICGAIVKDFGLTQVEPNTVTSIGFSPYHHDSDEGIFLDKITKDLSLL